MKTIATAAVLLMLAVPAWADEPQKEAKDLANSNEPIVLSEVEMDGVTAGVSRIIEVHNGGQDDWTTLPDYNGHSSTQSTIPAGKALFFPILN